MDTQTDDSIAVTPVASVSPVESVTPVATDRGRGFRALRYPGYRIYFTGMLARGTAVWMQLVAIPWLAVQLGASPIELGIVTALLFLPTLFIAALSGVLADRVERGRVLFITQSGSGLLSLGLWMLLLTESANLAWLAVAALAFGVLTAVELPVRQAYLTELVPRADVTSAVSLHATAWNVTRFVGPVTAGALIAVSGIAACFLVSAVVAFGVSVTVLWMDRFREKGRQRGRSSSSVLADLREGASFALAQPAVRWPLFMIAAAGILGIQAFQTLAPIFGPVELGLGPGAYGAYIGVWGLGGVAAAVTVTAFAHGDRRPWLIGGTLTMAGVLAVISLVQVQAVAFVLAFTLGFAQIALIQNALISVQGATPDALRGRIMGIYVTVFSGTSPFGALLAGWLAEAAGVRGAMFVAAAALAIVGVGAALALRRASWGGLASSTPGP